MKRDTGSANPREGIVKALREHPEGLTIKDISELTGSHRHTITKYVYELIGARVILERDVGAAKLCYLMETYMGKDAHAGAAMKGTLGFRQSWKGQAQLLTLLVALLLVPAGLIAAQSFGNSTATGGMAVAADGAQEGLDGGVIQQAADAQTPAVVSLPDASVASGGNESEIPEAAANETPSEEAATGTSAQNATIEEPANATIPEEDINVTTGANATAEDNAATADNGTGVEPVIVPEANETAAEDNVTVPDENVTIPDVNGTVPEANETIPEINETVPEANVTIPGSPEVEVFIENPAKITRGQDFAARAVVRNAGDAAAQNATLRWILPEGFSVASGNAVEGIGTIAAGEEKYYDIMVRTSIATARGVSEIRARVSYG